MKIAFWDFLGNPPPEADVLMLAKAPPGAAAPERLRSLAREGNCAVAGPLPQQRGGLRAALVTPHAEIIQEACYPAGDAERAADIETIDLPCCRAALCCGADVLQPQLARLAALRGAQLLLCAGWAFPVPGNAEPRDIGETRYRPFWAGPWSAAQANNIAVAVCGGGGNALVLPCALTPDNSGLGQTEFDVTELAAHYAEFPVFDSLNAAFARRYQKELSAW